MLFQFDVQTLTITSIRGKTDAMLVGNVSFADGHSAAPWSTLLQMMYGMCVCQSPARRRCRRMVMMMMMIGSKWVLVALFLHGEVVIVAARLQRVNAMGGCLQKWAWQGHYINDTCRATRQHNGLQLSAWSAVRLQ